MDSQPVEQVNFSRRREAALRGAKGGRERGRELIVKLADKYGARTAK